MKKAVFYVLAYLVLGISTGYTQNQGILQGKVVDAESGEPIYGASVLVHETGTGDYTDSLGNFRLTLHRGPYHLHIAFFGYETEYLNVKADSVPKDLFIKLKATTIELKQVVVEGELIKTKASKQSLTSVVVGEEFLEKNQSNTLSEALDRIPGVNSANTGTGISKPVIRGMTGNRVIVNEGGIKQEGQQWGMDHGLEIDQAGIGQVEIVKGPASYLYGSDGLGGVININPLPPPQPNSFTTEAGGIYRSNNNLLGFTASSAYRGKRNWVRARYSIQDYGDFTVPADSFEYLDFIFPIQNNKLKNTAGNIQSLAFSTGTIQSWGKVSATVSNYRQKAGFFTGAIGMPGYYSLQHDGNYRDVDLPYQMINHFKIRVNSEIFIGKNWLELDAGYQNNNREEHSQPHAHIKNAPPISGTNAHSWKLQTFSLNARYHYSVSDSLSFITGLNGEVQRNDRSGFEFLLPDYSRKGLGLFVYGNYGLRENLTLSGGLRGDIASLDVTSYSQPVYNSEQEIVSYIERSPAINREFLNWSGGIGLSWSLSKSFNSKLNFGRSFRVPNVPELSMNGVHHGTSRHEQGDSNLKSEKGYQFDLALTYDGKNHFVTASPYFNYYSNYIYLKPTVTFSPLPDGGQIYKYSQSSTYFSGFEIQAEYHPFKRLHLQSNAEYVYTYNYDSGLPLPFIPPFSWFSDIEYEMIENLGKLRETYLALEYNWVASQERTDRNERSTPGYSLFNVVAGSSVIVKDHKVRIILRVNNLFNKRYLKHLSRYRILNLPEQGRNVMVSLHYAINKSFEK